VRRLSLKENKLELAVWKKQRSSQNSKNNNGEKRDLQQKKKNKMSLMPALKRRTTGTRGGNGRDVSRKGRSPVLEKEKKQTWNRRGYKGGSSTRFLEKYDGINRAYEQKRRRREREDKGTARDRSNNIEHVKNHPNL